MNRLLLLIGIIILTCGIYAPILTNDLVWDDHDFLIRWETPSQIQNIPALLAGDLPVGHEGVYRPFRSLLYLGMKILFDSNPLPYHIFGLIIHVVSTILVFGITLKLFHKKTIAWIATLLFAIHPVHIESISYITTSFDTAGILFGLTSYYCYLLYRTSIHKIKIVMFLVSLSTALLAFATYEITLVLPFLILLTEIFILPNGTINSNAKRISPYIVVLIVYVIIRTVVLGTSPRGVLFFNWSLTLLTQTKAWWKIITSLFFPFFQSPIPTIWGDITSVDIRPDAIRSQQWSDLPSLLGVITVSGAITLFFWSWKYNKTLAFIIGWILISLLPTSLQLLTGTIFAEKYLYLASVGFAWLISLGFHSLYSTFPSIGKKVLIVLGCIGVCALSLQTFSYNQIWKNNTTLWKHAVGTTPRSAASWLNYGVGLTNDKRYKEAHMAFEESLSIFPNYAEVHINQGYLYEKQQDMKQALNEYHLAIEKNPYLTQHVINLAAYYANLGDIESATHVLKKGEKATPQDVRILENLKILEEASQSAQQ